MNIIVCVKQIVDLKQIRIKRETREPILEGLPLALSDLDKNALEAAIRLKEALPPSPSGRGAGGEVKITVVSVSASPKLKETMKEALAMGADEAVLVSDPAVAGNDPAANAALLAAAIKKVGDFDLILMGEGSADNYSGQIGPRVAELLGLPQVTYATGLEVTGTTAKVTRNLDEEIEVVTTPLPAVVTVLSEINEPRIPALAQILRAGRKPVSEYKAADLGITAVGPAAALTQVQSNLAPAQERKNVLFEGDQAVDQLLAALAREGVMA